MALEIRIMLDDELESKFLDIYAALKPTRGTKTVVKNELISDAINRFHKRLHKPQSVIDNLRDKDE